LRIAIDGWYIQDHFPRIVHYTYNPILALAKNESARAEYYRSLLYFYGKHYGKLRTAILIMLLPLYRWLVGPRR
jgi:hypothetical protein